MAKYRNNLPQNSGDLFLTDAGLETDLVFKHGYELPCFASFPLLNSSQGSELLFRYYCTYAEIAREFSTGLVLESPTWRASNAWGDQLGYDPDELDTINHKAVEMMQEIRSVYEADHSPMVISGSIGPRGDGYDPNNSPSADEASCYHYAQIKTFTDTDADFVSAFTIPTINEATGIVLAAKLLDMPVVISFTVETNGHLPAGECLQEAIETVDHKTSDAPVYYMVNCAHPTHFADTLDTNEAWTKRIWGLRANASCKSHAELDECDQLDGGHPAELGEQYKQIRSKHPQIRVLGGCCGTDERHVREIAKACVAMVS